jgi:hypothetical protein
MSDDLAEFLLARYADDEDGARRYAVIWSEDLESVSPRRVLAECEAKRGVVAVCVLMDGRPENILGSYAHEILCRLAAPYAGHPSYREEWKLLSSRRVQ